MAVVLALDIAWKIIPGFESYEISEHGEVRRMVDGGSPIARAGKTLTPNKWGNYQRVCLHHNGIRSWQSVHRLVAMAFIGPAPSAEHQVAHYDGDKWNNHFSNLRWATAKENCADKERHGTIRRGEDCQASLYTRRQINAVRHAYEFGLSVDHISAILGTSSSHILRIIKGEVWRDAS